MSKFMLSLFALNRKQVKEMFFFRKNLKSRFILVLSFALYIGSSTCFSLTLKELKDLRKEVIQKKILQMYEEDDLSAFSLFAGGFINFGYWDHSINDKVTVQQRIESEKNLYRYVLKKLAISKYDKVLEIGCGQGYGEALTFTEFQPDLVYGIDFSKVQIERAKKIHHDLINKASGRLLFNQGSAENISYINRTFDVVFSIEAAQHFTNINKFCTEAFRVLKPNGRLAIATFFATSESSSEQLLKMIQTAHDGIDHFRTVRKLKEVLRYAGFKRVEVTDIGKDVWQGFDKWIAQGEFKDTWNRNWYKAYKQGLVSYYVIVAYK